LVNRHDENPFKSQDRLYPVDFSVPIEEKVTIIINYPDNFTIVNLPEKVAIALPNNGGKYILSSQNSQNSASIFSWFVISRHLYSSVEYHYLKELFSTVVQTQNTDIIFRRE
jgi:hypothetical protein